MSIGWSEWKNDYKIENVQKFVPAKDGNNLYSCIVEAVKPTVVTVDQLRTYVAKQVLSEDEKLINDVVKRVYCADVDNKKFTGGWSPKTCKSREDLAAAIVMPVYTKNPLDFQGDLFILTMLSKALKIDLILFDPLNGECSRISKDDEKINNEHAIFLIYNNKYDYNLIGLPSESGITSCFDTSKLPSQLMTFAPLIQTE